ncbi:MAG: hypothetical protein JKY15_02105 [Deltaproteobacteria bacterium]|nr:hypothetical protein [Deltaproteobacteria bacterium]
MFFRVFLLLGIFTLVPRDAKACGGVTGIVGTALGCRVAVSIFGYANQGLSIATSVLSGELANEASHSSFPPDKKDPIKKKLIGSSTAHGVASLFGLGAASSFLFFHPGKGDTADARHNRSMALVIMSGISTLSALVGLGLNGAAYAEMPDIDMTESMKAKAMIGSSITSTVLDAIGTAFALTVAHQNAS